MAVKERINNNCLVNGIVAVAGSVLVWSLIRRILSVSAIADGGFYVIGIVLDKEQMNNPARRAGFGWLELKIRPCRRPFQIAGG